MTKAYQIQLFRIYTKSSYAALAGSLQYVRGKKQKWILQAHPPHLRGYLSEIRF